MSETKPCIRCGKLHASVTIISSAVPFARLYCAECLEVRKQERYASNVVIEAIEAQNG